MNYSDDFKLSMLLMSKGYMGKRNNNYYQYYINLNKKSNKCFNDKIEIIENIPELSHYEFLKIKKQLLEMKKERYYLEIDEINNLNKLHKELLSI